MPATPSERSLLASLASHESWARTEDRVARTAAARAAALSRFEREADPDGVLTSAERQRRAEHLHKAHMTRLSLKAATSRRKAREARAAADALEQQAYEAEATLDRENGSGISHRRSQIRSPNTVPTADSAGAWPGAAT